MVGVSELTNRQTNRQTIMASKKKNKGTLTISAVVALFAACGYEEAAEWDRDTLMKRCKQLPKKVLRADVPEEHAATYDALDKAVELGKLTIVGSASPSKPSKKKAAVKPKKAAAAKADPAPAKPKKGKSKKGKSKKASPSDELPLDDERKPAKEKGPKYDPYGGRIGSLNSRVQMLMHDGKRRSAQDVADELGISLKQARLRLYRGTFFGWLTHQREITFVATGNTEKDRK